MYIYLSFPLDLGPVENRDLANFIVNRTTSNLMRIWTRLGMMVAPCTLIHIGRGLLYETFLMNLVKVFMVTVYVRVIASGESVFIQCLQLTLFVDGAVLRSSVMSDSLQPHGLQPARLLCLWRFSRQEYQSELPCTPPGDLPNPGIEPRSPSLQADSVTN